MIRAVNTLKELEEIIPPDPATGRVAVVLDGTHVPVDRTKDKDRRRINYSGKKKAFTPNTNVLTDTSKRILWIGRTAPGSTHDLTLLKEDHPDLGNLTRAMSDGDTPGQDRPVLYVDKRYQGISEHYSGADARQPAKRRRNSDRPTGGLTQEERARNKEINGIRVVVEHAIGRIKQYRIHQALLRHARGVQRVAQRHLGPGEPEPRLGQDKGGERVADTGAGQESVTLTFARYQTIHRPAKKKTWRAGAGRLRTTIRIWRDQGAATLSTNMSMSVIVPNACPPKCDLR